MTNCFRRKEGGVELWIAFILLSSIDLNSLRREKWQGGTLKSKYTCAKNLCLVIIKSSSLAELFLKKVTASSPQTFWTQRHFLSFSPTSSEAPLCVTDMTALSSHHRSFVVLTWERMLVHCCSRDTGGLPMLVASWTLSSCSFWVAFPCSAWARATAAHQFERESVEKRPPQSSWPAETELPVAANREMLHTSPEEKPLPRFDRTVSYTLLPTI